MHITRSLRNCDAKMVFRLLISATSPSANDKLMYEWIIF